MVLGRAESCSMIQQGTGEAHPWASAQGALGHQASFPLCAVSSCGSISPACTRVSQGTQRCGWKKHSPTTDLTWEAGGSMQGVRDAAAPCTAHKSSKEPRTDAG